MNLPTSPRWCLTTSRPGAATSRTRQKTRNIPRRAPHAQLAVLPPDAEMDAAALDGGRDLDQRRRGERQRLLEEQRLLGAVRRHERQRDFRDVAFLAAQARPERGVDDRLDVCRLGQRELARVDQARGRDVLGELFLDARRDRARGGIGRSGHQRHCTCRVLGAGCCRVPGAAWQVPGAPGKLAVLQHVAHASAPSTRTQHLAQHPLPHPHPALIPAPAPGAPGTRHPPPEV